MTTPIPTVIEELEECPSKADFRTIVEDLLENDARFQGMARYLLTITFWWSTQIKTACAGYGFIFFNPDYWDKLKPEQQKTVVAHEIEHLIRRHMERGEGKHPDDYNQAADHVINNDLQDEGFPIYQDSDYGGITPCCDPKFKGMSTTEVYEVYAAERKKREEEEDPEQPCSGNGSGVGSGSGNPQGYASKEQIEDMIEQILDQSPGTEDLQDKKDQADKNHEEAFGGSGIGNQSGQMQRTIQNELSPTKRVEEKEIIEIFEDYLIDPLSGGKRTYLRPSRRQLNGRPRLKGNFPKQGRKNRLTHLVYALDVSGSISPTDASDFLTSSAAIKKTLNPKYMTVFLWDTRIVYEKTFSETEEITGINVRAGGGTSLNPVYSKLEQIKPEAVVIFTDLQVRIPAEPSWKTIWFVPRNLKGQKIIVPYGDLFCVPLK